MLIMFSSILFWTVAMLAKLAATWSMFSPIFSVLASIASVFVAIAASFSVAFSVAEVIAASKPLTLVSS